jgi:hypothetical protein
MSTLSTTQAALEFRRLNAELDAANLSGDIQLIQAALTKLTDFADREFFGNSGGEEKEVAWVLLAALVEQIERANLRDERERDFKMNSTFLDARAAIAQRRASGEKVR